MPKVKKKSYSQKQRADQTRKRRGKNVANGSQGAGGPSPEQTQVNPPGRANTGQSSHAVHCDLTNTLEASNMVANGSQGADGPSPEQTQVNPPGRANTGQSSHAVHCDLTNTLEASNMSTTTHSYHPDVLTQLIGDNNTEVPDDIIVAALELMKANCDTDTSEYYGYYTPAAIHNLMNSSDTMSDFRLPVNKNSIHIHPLTGHWVTSYFIASCRQLYVFDSVKNPLHLLEVKQQLLKMYDSDIANNLIYSKVTQQCSEPLCGVMAVAFAFTCFLGHNPSTVNYDISRARQHLKTCFETATVSTFPVTTNADSNWFYSYLAEQQQRYGECKQNRSAEKEQSGRIRKAKSRRMRTEEQVERQKVKERAWQAKSRQLRTEEQVERQKVKERAWQAKSRQLRTEKQVERQKVNDKVGKAKSRRLRTKEQVERQKVNDKVGKAKSRRLRTEKQIERQKVNDKVGKAKSRRLRTEKPIERQKVNDKVRKAKSRRLRTEKQIERQKVNDKVGKAKSRRLRTEKQIERQKVNDKVGKAKSRRLRTEEQEERQRVKEIAWQAKSRQLRTEEQVERQKVNDKVGKAKSRQLRTEEQVERQKVNDKVGKAKSRRLRTEEQEERQRVKEIAWQAKSRQLRTEEQVERQKVNDKVGKAKSRQLRTEEQVERQKVNDKVGKAKSRQLRTEEQVERQKVNDKVGKARSRGRRTEEQVERDRASDILRKRKDKKDVESALRIFRNNITDAAEYVCTVCHRLLYRNSVNKFIPTSKLTQVLSTGQLSPDQQEYICTTCKRHLNSGKIPPQAQANKLDIPEVPAVLGELTDFEARLLARRYPFMKIVQLPKGKQRGILGRVVNVPVDAAELCTSLPRTLSTSGILPVKLKRKRLYKGHVCYQNIRPEKIKQAFCWLLKHNTHYQNVVETSNWEEQCKEQNADIWKHLTEAPEANASDSCLDDVYSESDSSDSSSLDNSSDHVSDADDSILQMDDNVDVTQFDTCIQPADPTADTSDILSIAPGEGKHPLHIMMDPSCEEQSFPQLFPSGCYGFNCEREIKLTPKKYFNARILNRKGHFAKNIEYLFFAQYVTEHKQVMDTMSIAVRKTFRASPTDSSIDAGFIKNPDRLKSLILKDKAFNFLQTVRGSPPYWQKIMFKLMAAVKQFGIFSLFVTLSSADLKWNDTLNAILRQQGRQLTNEEIEGLTWEERCALLRSNPVTTARHFDHRLQCCFNDLLLSPAQVLGKVVHYSYRIEFQQRGSPHAHGVLWIEDAPGLADDPKEIAEYIDKYISCTIPSEEDDPELYSLVTTVQKHHHTATCRKKGTVCRFHYPKLPSPSTIIAAPLDSNSEAYKAATLDTASEVLMDVMDTLDKDKENKITTIDELLSKCNITMEQYLYCLSITKTGRTVVLQRNPNEMFINCYNKDLLRAWQANLDVQFCLDPYACIAYMVSYITKDEREMSAVLRNITREMAHQDWREQLKSCANAFLNARELSAQEAVYRLLSLPLFKSNFSTVFVPADVPEKRVAFLKPMGTVLSMEDDEEDIYTTSIIDRYSARPERLSVMCLAEFAVSYILDKKVVEGDSDQEESEETSVDYIQLKNGMGTMKKRSKKSVLRYHHKSEAKQPDEYYHSQLMLFLPWCDESTEILNLESYEQHYNDNKETILQNRSQLEHHADIICRAVEQFEELGPPTHAYDDVAAHTIQENEDLPEAQEDEDFAVLDPDNTDKVADTPSTDFPVASGSTTSVLEKRPGIWKEEDYYKHIRDLNEQQRDVFQSVFTWCCKRSLSLRTGICPEQLCLFVSGGAGTGKSHLISALYQMALRAFQAEGENPDDVHVLLTAPTGTAAHNIGGVTLHSAFLLPLGQTGSFAALSDDKRNTIRSKTSHLELLIIDEISMVGTNLFLQLHYRLCEIKCSKQPFGGVSVLVFGDLYQLPPVKQKFIFEEVSDRIARLHGSLWHEFQLTELTKIMRQKEDVQFAELLNRVRTQSHTKDDIRILKARQLEPPSKDKEALHVFPTNAQVNAHNDKHLDDLKHPLETVAAVDKKPISLKNFQPSHDPRFTGGLANEVRLKIDAKVMLIKNLDVLDGLVNGAQGKIVGFIRCRNGPDEKILAILIEFNSNNVGQNARQTSQFSLELDHYPQATPILRAETSFTVSRKNKDLKVVRYQFPVKLSWACTIHKVQGLTLDAVVVSFERRYACGQAYVALSRGKTLDRLYLSNFDEKKLTCSTKVNSEMDHLRSERKLPLYYEFLINWRDAVIISVLNTRSYLRHREELLHDPVFRSSDVVVLSETWLGEQHVSADIVPDTHTCFRSDKPTNSSDSRAGGVAVLVKNGSFSWCEHVSSTEEKYIQTITVQVTTRSGETFNIIGVYNSPSNTIKACETEVLRHANEHEDYPSICTGDFNIKDHFHMMKEIGFKQHVSGPTHISGSCLDHLYSRHFPDIHTRVVPCYYSDHDWVTSYVANIHM